MKTIQNSILDIHMMMMMIMILLIVSLYFIVEMIQRCHSMLHRRHPRPHLHRRHRFIIIFLK